MDYVKRNFICDRCKKSMSLEDARIEWIGSKSGEVHFCHNECSDGYNGSNNVDSDIMHFLWDFPQNVYDSLTNAYKEYGNVYCLEIRKQLFGQ